MSNILFAMTGAYGVCGGISSANRSLLYALAELAEEKKISLIVFSLWENEKCRPDSLPEQVRFYGFRGNKINFIFSLLKAALARVKPLFCFDHVRLALPLLPLATFKVINTIIFAHGSEAWKRIRKMNLWSFKQACLCLTNSYFTLRKMQERMPNLKVRACPLGLPPEYDPIQCLSEGNVVKMQLPSADGRSQVLKDRVLLLVARMDSREKGQKGHRLLVKILPELLKKYPDVQLVFAGPGDDRSNLIHLACQTQVASAVFLPGYLQERQLKLLYQNAYAFVMPSLQEGFGLAYLEAMHYQKACIGCFNQGAEEIIIHEKTGFLIRNPNNSQELLSTILRLLDDPALTQRLGRNGYARLRENFTSSHYRERVKKEIAKVLDEKNKRLPH